MKWDEHSDLRIDALLDGELSEDDEAVLMAEAAQDPALQAEIDAALRLKATLQSIPAPEPDPAMKQELMHRISRTTDRAPQRRVRKFAPVASALAMITIALVLIVTDGRPTEDQYLYTEAEVEQALADVQWALGYVSHMGERAGKIVRDEAIVGRTIEPVRAALDRANRIENNDNQ
jgi:anti-sigma factor RsiW